ncbi:MAG: (E)-4-hydroxy-3-methylbut-2-enyl-diphosphate synthase [Bacteroidales bacterium]|nr:(E)-4-hydroxy-3-methylbut-2-enyl-diphosphate synthase [Bacteroidales bacterium]
MLVGLVQAGNCGIGMKYPIKVQTMCNTFTQDIDKSVAQCVEMAAAGADLIRLTTQGLKEVEALKEIKAILRGKGIDIPLVADVHFSSEVAIEVAKVADKVRINPGNFAKDHDEACRQLKKFLDVCKEYGTAVRIGVNHGSLGERIINKYGDTPLGMKEAAMEWIRMCEENEFYNLVISLKASNTIVMATAYRLLWEEMQKNSMIYPLHLGVTEAGNGDTGRIKSAVGIGALLKEGIGNTIRVSLTEDPVNEIPVGKIIAEYFDSGEYKKNLERIGTPAKGTVPHCDYECCSWDEFIIKASCDFGPMLLDKEIDDFTLTAKINGEVVPDNKLEDFKDNLQQAARRKFTKPEYIACPGCGRTLYNLEETFNEVKRRTSHLKGVKIAIMGCIVNGPGEMADADFGYVGEGKGKVAIYKGKEPVLRSVPQEEAIDKLLDIIEKNPLE